MIRWWYPLVALAGLGVGAEQAGAYYLHMATARPAAEREVARVGDRVRAVSTHIAACYRRSGRTVDCRAIYVFKSSTCRRTVRVYFASARTRSPSFIHRTDTVCS